MNDTARQEYRYWAFVSYSSKDGEFARWLHRSIETYSIPVQLVSHKTPVGVLAPRRFRPVFHDRSELPASADLGARIEEALRASHYLIVICSPHAARSRWVNKEIETFLRLGRVNQILPIILDGEPHVGGERECFPPSLLDVEPIAADARPNVDGRNNAKLKLLAGMLGVSFDALKHRDSQLRIRRMQMAFSSALVLTLIFAGLAGFAWWQRRVAVQQRELALERTGSLRQVLSGLIWELNDEVEDVPGALKLKDDLLDGAENYLSQLKTEDPSDDGLSREVAVTYSKLGRVKSDMGRLTEARSSLERAISIDQTLIGHDPQNGMYGSDLGSDLRAISAVYVAQGNPDAAAQRLSHGIAILQQLVTVLPIREHVQRELAAAHLLSARIAWNRGSSEEAKPEFMQSVEMYESLAKSYPANLSYASELAGAYFQLAQFYRLAGELAVADGYCSKGAEILKKLNDSEASFNAISKVSASGIYEIAESLLARGLIKESATDVESGTSLLQDVRRTDPQDAVAQLILAQGQLLQARILGADNAFEEATHWFLEAAQNGKQLAQIDSTNTEAWALEAMAKGELARTLQRSGEMAESSRYAQECFNLVNGMRKSGQTLTPPLRLLLREMGDQGVE